MVYCIKARTNDIMKHIYRYIDDFHIHHTIIFSSVLLSISSIINVNIPLICFISSISYQIIS